MRDLILRVVYDGATYDLDVNPNIPLRLDISVAENTQLGKVFGVGSQTFDLPGTKKNNKFFEHAYEVGAIDVPGLYSYVTAYVLLDGDLILQGKLQLTEVLTDEFGYVAYKCNLIDDAISFASELEDKLIVDADFSPYNHILNSASIVDSWIASTSSAFLSGSIFYPLCDYGTDDKVPFPQQPRIQIGGSGSASGSIDNQNTPMQLQQFLPAIRAKELVDVIVNQAGFSYTSNFIQGPDFQNLYVLPKSSEDLGITGAGLTDNTFIASSSIADTQNWSNLSPNSSTGSRLIYSLEVSDPGGNYVPATSIYTVPVAGNYSFEASMRFDLTSPAGGTGRPTMTLSINKNGTTELASAFETFPIGTAGGTTESLDAATPGAIALQAGDTITADWFIDNANNSQLPGGTIYADSPQPSFFSDTAPSNFIDVPVTMSEQFDGKTLSIDLYLGLVNQFNLITTPDPDNPRNILIEPFDNWIQLGRTVDWTEKVDQAKRMSIKHPISEQSRTIINKNADDKDRFSVLSQDNDPNFQYGTRRTISNSNITKGETVIESLYGPTVLGSIIASGSVDADGNATFNLSNNSFVLPHLYKFDNRKQKSYIFKPRIGYKVTNLGLVNADGNTIKIGSSAEFITSSVYATLSNLSAIPASLESKNLHFDNQYIDLIPASLNQDLAETAYNTYWKSYIDSLYWDEARKVVVDIKFTPEEYKDIRLNDKIIIKNQSYRINKISGFNLQQPDIATVELIKFYPNRNPGTFLTPTPSPSISITPSISTSPSQTPTVTPTRTTTATPSVSFGTSPSPTPTPTKTPSVSQVSGFAFERTDSESTDTIACSQLASPNIYFDSATPSNGDTAYTNASLSTIFVGDGGWYGIVTAGTGGVPEFSVNISALGVLSNKTTCTI